MRKLDIVYILIMSLLLGPTVAYCASGSAGAYALAWADSERDTDDDEDDDYENVRTPSGGPGEDTYNWEYELRASAYVIGEGPGYGSARALSRVWLTGPITWNYVEAEISIEDEEDTKIKRKGTNLVTGTGKLTPYYDKFEFYCDAYTWAEWHSGDNTNYWAEAACYGWGDISIAQ